MENTRPKLKKAGIALSLLIATFILFSASCNADNGNITEGIWIIPGAITLLAMLAIAYIYQQISKEDGLEKRIKKNREILRTQMREIRENQEKIERQKKLLDEKEEKEVSGEIEEVVKGHASFRRGSRGIRGDFWDKLGRVGSSKEEEKRRKLLRKGLREEREKIQEMIKLTKQKYHKKEIGETGFKEMINEYQRKLIEIEAKINELQKNEGL